MNTWIQCCHKPNSSDWALCLDMSRQLCWWAMSPQASCWATRSFQPLSLKNGWALPWRTPARFLFSWGRKKEKDQVSAVCRDKLSLQYQAEETSRFTSAAWSRWKFRRFETFACLVCLCKAIPSLQAGLPRNPSSRVPHWSPSPVAGVWLYPLAFSLRQGLPGESCQLHPMLPDSLHLGALSLQFTLPVYFFAPQMKLRTAEHKNNLPWFANRWHVSCGTPLRNMYVWISDTCTWSIQEISQNDEYLGFWLPDASLTDRLPPTWTNAG